MRAKYGKILVYKNLDELKAHYTKGGLGDVKVKLFLNNIPSTLLIDPKSALNGMIVNLL